MICKSFSISSNYSAEIVLFNKIRNFKDGISFFEFTINYDKYLADHTPRFELFFLIFNITILEFNIYYKFHRDNDEN